MISRTLTNDWRWFLGSPAPARDRPKTRVTLLEGNRFLSQPIWPALCISDSVTPSFPVTEQRFHGRNPLKTAFRETLPDISHHKIMINLTTNRCKSDTVPAALTTILSIVFATFLPILQEPLELPAPEQTARKIDEQQEQLLQLDDQSAQEPQVLMRGPLHEAFADVHQANPVANPLVSRQPPEPINELAPEFRPEGENVQWISGYWAWDDEQQDFIWISGVWRDVPPNRRWVPGYWSDSEGEDGYRWISGFWISAEQEELGYVPEPPANLDNGPSIAAPSDDYFYCPGNWEYQNSQFVWRSGHWQPRVTNWIWIPARYIWTPCGYIYRPGFWDYEFDYRGTAFAPVYFQEPIYQVDHFHYCPDYSINTGVDFFVHLFVRNNCNHYFYGDWYGRDHGGCAYEPWVSSASHYRNYDPLLNHYNCRRYNHGGQLFINWVNVQHTHYHDHHHLRPRPTVHEHEHYVNRKHRAHIDGPQLPADHHEDHIYRAKLASKYVVDGQRAGHEPGAGTGKRKPRYVKVDKKKEDSHEQRKRVQYELARARRRTEGIKGQQGSSASGQKVAGNNRVKLPRVDHRPRRSKNANAGKTGDKIRQAQRDAEHKRRQQAAADRVAEAKMRAAKQSQQREIDRQRIEKAEQDRKSEQQRKVAADQRDRERKRARQRESKAKADQIARQREDARRKAANQAAADRAHKQTQQREAKRQAEALAKQQAAAKSAADHLQQQSRQRQIEAKQKAEQREAQRKADRMAQQRKSDAKATADRVRHREAQEKADKLARQRADAQHKAAAKAQQEAARRDAQRKAAAEAQRDAARREAQRKAAAEAQQRADRLAKQRAAAQEAQRQAAAKAQQEAARREAQRKAAAKAQQDAARREAQRKAAAQAQQEAAKRAQREAQRRAEQAKRQQQQKQAKRGGKRKKRK